MSSPMPQMKSHIEEKIDESPATLEALKKALLAYTQRQLMRIEAEYAENPFTLTPKQWLPIAQNYIETLVAAQVLDVLKAERPEQDNLDSSSDSECTPISPEEDERINKQAQNVQYLQAIRRRLFPIAALNAAISFQKIEVLTFILHILNHPEKNVTITRDLRQAMQNSVMFKFEEIIFTHSHNYLNEFGPGLIQSAKDMLAKYPMDLQEKVLKRLEGPVAIGLMSATHFDTLTENKLGMLSTEGFRAYTLTILDECRERQVVAKKSIYEWDNPQAGSGLTPLAILTEIACRDDSEFAKYLNTHRNLAKFVVSEKVTQAGDTTTMKGYKTLMQALRDGTLDALGEDYQPLPEVPTPETVVKLAMACSKTAEREKYLVSHYATFVQSSQFTAALKAELLSLVAAELERYEAEENKIRVKHTSETPLLAKMRVLRTVQERLQQEPAQTILNEMLDAKSDIGAVLAKPRGGSSTPEIITKLQERQSLLTTPGRAHLNTQGEVEIEQTKGRQAKQFFGRLFGSKAETSSSANNNNNNNIKAIETSRQDSASGLDYGKK
jgi:hypothetical protein